MPAAGSENGSCWAIAARSQSSGVAPRIAASTITGRRGRPLAIVRDSGLPTGARRLYATQAICGGRPATIGNSVDQCGTGFRSSGRRSAAGRVASGALKDCRPCARLSHAALHPRPPRRPDPDLPRRHHRRVLADPADPGRSDRGPGRRARHRSRAPRHAQSAVRLRQAAVATVPQLSRRSGARRPRQLDHHAPAGAAGVLHPVSGHRRARGRRDPAGHADRAAGRDRRRGQPRLGVRPRPDGRVAHRLLDADLLVGPAADHPVLGHPALDAGVRAHRRALLLRAGHRLPA